MPKLWSVARAVGWMVLGAVIAVLTIYVLVVRDMPQRQAWHGTVLPEECGTGHRCDDFADLLERERLLFDGLAARVSEWKRPREGNALDRFAAGSWADPAARPRNWNRTFELDVDRPAGVALLLHGLSDSPYSLRAIGESFHQQGFRVLGLRLPGHGTTPGALAQAHAEDWRDAVRLAARHLQQPDLEGRPFVIVGYSNGALLALDYVLDTLDQNRDAKATHLVLVSPALQVTPAAGLARFQRRLSALPGLEKLAWTGIQTEYDPFKYASFPVRSGEEIYTLSTRTERRMSRLAAAGRGGELPPVLALQSVVDATIVPEGIVHRLLARVTNPGSSLVLFDVNRIANARAFMRVPATGLPVLSASTARLPYDLTVITNASPAVRDVTARTRPAGTDTWSETPLGVAWPQGVFSMSHIALPFPPDDPVYGLKPASADPGAFTLGDITLRGERHVFGVPMDEVMRLRYNPFFDYLRNRVIQFVVDKDGG